MKFTSNGKEDGWREITERVISLAQKKGATYADCRIVFQEQESLGIEGFEEGSAKIASASKDSSEGMGVRVVLNGTWGFAAGSFFGKVSADDLTERAIRSASANAKLQHNPVILAPVEALGFTVYFASQFLQDPFDVSWEEKIGLLLRVDEAMRKSSISVFKREADLSFVKTRKILGTSDGVFAIQEFMESGASIAVHARRFPGDDAQRRSYPDSHVHYVRGGWETIEDLDLVGHAPKLVEEASMLLHAPYCPEGERDVILLSTQSNLHCGHETIHGFEADRVLGTEWTLAGGSFITPILSQIGSYRFGSEHVNIIADSFHPQGVATFACDDEGTPAARTYLVKEGVLVGLLTSRETVPQLNRILGREYFKTSGATVRGMDAESFPLIRMVNILIEPGELPFEEMKERVPEGTIMLGTNKSWSIDDIRRHFNFGTEIAWEKVGGRWELRKNAKYSGDNLNFFRNCQGFADKTSFFMHGIGNCGKDVAPIQSIPTGHGSSPGWFSKVKVGSVGHMAPDAD